VLSSDLPGVNPATLNGMILYYRLMNKRSGLGNSTELSWMGLSQYKSIQHGNKRDITLLLKHQGTTLRHKPGTSPSGLNQEM
jgi:hypothetical protein